MNLSADEYLHALKPPQIEIGGRVFTGRHLSFEEWGRLAGQFEEVRERTKGNQVRDLLQFRDLVRAVCDAVFPRTAWWKFWERRVSTRLVKMPLALQVEFIRRFSTSQARVFRDDADALRAPTVTRA